MWFEQQASKFSTLGVWLRPVLKWFIVKVIRMESDQWRYDLAKWAMAPLIVVQKPVWFTSLIVTACTEPQPDVRPESK